MTLVCMIPAMLSCWLLAAHFLRQGNLLVVILCLLAPLLLLPRRRMALRAMQGLLLLGTLEWLFTILNVHEQRVADGQPWLRMAVILGAVGLFTLASALLLQAPAIRRRGR